MFHTGYDTNGRYLTYRLNMAELMEKNLLPEWGEIVFGSSDSARSQAIRRALQAKQLLKLAPRLYTSNFQDSPKDNAVL